MNFDKYKNDGWGLSIRAFEDLYDIISNHKKDCLSILEFGSGISTRFLVDIAEHKNLTIESYDNDPKWCFQDADRYSFLNLNMRDLVECSDNEFADMFLKKEYNPKNMKVRQDPPHTRQKNCFYDIREEDLKKEYDVVILDGPNGNGRSFAFMHLHKVLKPDSYILIDDYQHYPFVKILKHFFNVEKYSESNVSKSEQHIIYRVKEIL